MEYLKSKLLRTALLLFVLQILLSLSTCAVSVDKDKELKVSPSKLDEIGDWEDIDDGEDLDDSDEWEYEEEAEGEFEMPVDHDKLVKPQYLYARWAMKELANIDKGVYQSMKTYVDKLDNRINLMKRFMRDYEESSVHEMSIEDEDEMDKLLVANPLISHRLIKRFAVDFNEVVQTFEEYTDEDFVTSLGKLNEKLVYPSIDEDYTESLKSILRIYQHSKYDAYQLSNGEFGLTKSPIGLNSYHTFDVSVMAERVGELAMSIEWLEVAIKKLNESQDSPEFAEAMKQKLNLLVTEHDTNWNASAPYRHVLFTEKIGGVFGPQLPKRGTFFNVLLDEAAAHRNETNYSPNTKANFMSMCADKDLQTLEEKSSLYCWYEQEMNPYWKINPLKTELLSESPRIVQIYEILGPQMINNLIKTATPLLKRSQVIDVNNSKKNDFSDERTSVQTWLYSSSTPWLNKITKTIECATGLRLEGDGVSEAYQIASYGTSHHYDAHLDALIDVNRTKGTGDRIGTFMLYLSDVDVGGKTAFPVVGISATPVKGSAVFWHNLMHNGQVDKRTWHGGCPVVHGIKWVANKWIRYNGNWDKRKCLLDPLK